VISLVDETFCKPCIDQTSLPNRLELDVGIHHTLRPLHRIYLPVQDPLLECGIHQLNQRVEKLLRVLEAPETPEELELLKVLA
jgi:hypothetical protein